MINSNKVLQSKILNVQLEYENVGTVSCSMQYPHPSIKCGIASNTNRSIKRARLWLVLNDRLKFDVKEMYHYYDYLHITSTDPTISLIHMTNKEVTVNSEYIKNTQTLSCVVFGDNIKMLVIQAIYISSSQLKCPLSNLVFENANITLHITNDVNYFN